MKTSDFKEQVGNFRDIFVTEDGSLITINEHVYLGSDVIAQVYKNRQYAFNVQIGFDRLPDTRREALFNILIEYTTTPVFEREEEKKFLVYVPATNGQYLYSKRVGMTHEDELVTNHINGYKSLYSTTDSRSHFEFTIGEMAKYGISNYQREEVADNARTII